MILLPTSLLRNQVSLPLPQFWHKMVSQPPSLFSLTVQCLLMCVVQVSKIQLQQLNRKSTLEYQKRNILLQTRFKTCNRKNWILKRRGLICICVLRSKDIRANSVIFSAIMNSTFSLLRRNVRAKLLLQLKKTKTRSQSRTLDMKQSFRELNLSMQQTFRNSKTNLEYWNNSMKVNFKSIYRNTTKKWQSYTLICKLN